MTTRSSSATPDAASGKKKRKQPISTVHRTQAYLRERGALVDVVERHLTAFAKKDCFGFADLVAIVPGQVGVAFLQITTQPHVWEHVRAYATDEVIRAAMSTILHAGNRIALVAWGKRVRGAHRRGVAPRPAAARGVRWAPSVYVITTGVTGLSLRGPVPLVSDSLDELYDPRAMDCTPEHTFDNVRMDAQDQR